jgi:hypothetical protein
VITTLDEAEGGPSLYTNVVCALDQGLLQATPQQLFRASDTINVNRDHSTLVSELAWLYSGRGGGGNGHVACSDGRYCPKHRRQSTCLVQPRSYCVRIDFQFVVVGIYAYKSLRFRTRTISVYLNVS